MGILSQTLIGSLRGFFYVFLLNLSSQMAFPMILGEEKNLNWLMDQFIFPEKCEYWP